MTQGPASETEPEVRTGRRRLLAVAGAVGVVVLVAVSVTADVAAEGDLPVADAVLGLTLLVIGVAAVAAITHGFVVLRRHGRVWSGRAGSLVLLVASVCALVLAVEYDNAHRYPNGQATTLGQVLLLIPTFGILAGLISLGVTWRRVRLVDSEPSSDSTVSGRAAGSGKRGARTHGYPPAGAEPPFEFRFPNRAAWHLIVLPATLVVLLVLGIVSVVVHDPGPVLVPVAILWLLSPLLLPLILRSYWRRLTVSPDGLGVVRMGTDRFIPWNELRRIETEPDPDSQDSRQRMRLITSRGRYVTDVPKGAPDELVHWRDVILAARPASSLPASEDDATEELPVAQRLLRVVKVRRRGAVLLLLCILLAAPILLGLATTGR